MQRNFPVPQNKNAVPLLEKDLTDKIIGAAIEVHKVLRVGLLINFNAPVLKDGIYRRVL